MKDTDDKKIIRLVEYSLKNQEFSINMCCEACGIEPVEFSGWKYQLYELNGANEQASPDKEMRWRLAPSALWGFSAIKAQERSDHKSRIAIYIAIGSMLIAFIGVLFYIVLGGE